MMIDATQDTQARETAGGGSRARVALIGTGHRAQMFIKAITGPHADVAQLVGLADRNPGRVDYYLRSIASQDGDAPVVFAPEDLTRFIKEQRVERVIVTTPDFTHADYIVESMHAGADVVVEKPLTIDAEGCRRIMQAIEATGRDLVVTFNYRYSPRNSALKQIVQSGALGTITSVDFTWLLDTVHGADYFRRWHRDKTKSGGLLVHKASHHFDLVNWWINDVPERVFASGGLRFYGDRNAASRGLGPRPERGTNAGGKDPFSLDLRDDERLRALYLDNEHHDGYRRDQDVFSPGITIEDNMALIVDYARGATLSYSLNAHAPWEGYRVAINGTAGRAELEVVERAVVTSSTDKKNAVDPSVTEATEADALRKKGARLLVQKHWERAYEVPVPSGGSGHGGGDVLLLSDLFNGAGDDPLGRPSGYLDGVRAVGVGIAGNRSLETGQAVRLSDLNLGADLSRNA